MRACVCVLGRGQSLETLKHSCAASAVGPECLDDLRSSAAEGFLLPVSRVRLDLEVVVAQGVCPDP